MSHIQTEETKNLTGGSSNMEKPHKHSQLTYSLEPHLSYLEAKNVEGSTQVNSVYKDR